MTRKIKIGIPLITLLLIILFILSFCTNDLSEKENIIISSIRLENVKNLIINNSDYSDNIEVFLYTFMSNKNKYIGFASFFNHDMSNRQYNTDNLVSINYDPMNDKIPLNIYTHTFETPSRYMDMGNGPNNYIYYYGNVNNTDIKEIIMKFDTRSIHINPVNNIFYSTLITNEALNIEYIRGVDSSMETIYEEKYNY